MELSKEERQELRRIINTVWKAGINKKKMFEAISHYLVINYVKITHLQSLEAAIKEAGGYDQWREELIDDLQAKVKYTQSLMKVEDCPNSLKDKIKIS